METQAKKCCCACKSAEMKKPAMECVTCKLDQDPVHEHYSEVAKKSTNAELATKIAAKSGYSSEELASIPPEANLGLGCGNSVAAAEIKLGEFVLDLGCGAGMDVFLVGVRVGPSGKAVGVDFSADMINHAKEIALKYKRTNVEFMNCAIDQMPFKDNQFNVVISNCVLNLLPDKQKAFKEIARVLKKGSEGRFVVSDIVLKKELPTELRENVAAVVGCLGRAVTKEEYTKNLELAGLTGITIEDKKRDLMNLYYKPGFDKSDCKEKGEGCGCCSKQKGKVDTTVLDKYDLNEYAMSCIIKAIKK